MLKPPSGPPREATRCACDQSSGRPSLCLATSCELPNGATAIAAKPTSKNNERITFTGGFTSSSAELPHQRSSQNGHWPVPCQVPRNSVRRSSLRISNQRHGITALREYTVALGY